MRKAYILCPHCFKPITETTVALDYDTPVILSTAVSKENLPKLKKELEDGVAIEDALPWKLEEYLDSDAEFIAENVYCPYCEEYIELHPKERTEDYIVVIEKTQGKPFRIVYKGESLEDLMDKDILEKFALLI